MAEAALAAAVAAAAAAASPGFSAALPFGPAEHIRKGGS